MRLHLEQLYTQEPVFSTFHLHRYSDFCMTKCFVQRLTGVNQHPIKVISPKAIGPEYCPTCLQIQYVPLVSCETTHCQVCLPVLVVMLKATLPEPVL